MIVVGDDIRKLVLQALNNEREQLALERSIPLADRADDDESIDNAIKAYEAIHDAILNNRFIIMNTRPMCMAAENGKACDQWGRYVPMIVLISAAGQPIGQAETNPPMRLCEKHATSNIDHYVPPDKWREISAETTRQTGQILRRDDAKIMFVDSESGQLVPPPTPGIITA